MRAGVPPHAAVDDEGAHAQRLHAVEVVEVVFQVELVEGQGREEGGVVRGAGRGAEEGDGEVGSLGWVRGVSGFWLGWGGGGGG